MRINIELFVTLFSILFFSAGLYFIESGHPFIGGGMVTACFLFVLIILGKSLKNEHDG